MFYNLLSLLETSTVIVGGETGAASQVADAASNTAAAAGAAPGALGFLPMILIYAALFGALYFFTFRPQRKREKQLKELQSNIRSGDNVVTTSGFYGKVMDVGEDCFIVEFGTNRGIRIPVSKNEIVGIKSPKVHVSATQIPSDPETK